MFGASSPALFEYAFPIDISLLPSPFTFDVMI
jgi:hypothetical protein